MMVDNFKDKKVGLYARVSTDKQEAENQLKQLREYTLRKGGIIYGEFVDVISGREDKRPAWDNLFRSAHLGAYDVLLFWDFSRFSRSGTQYTLQKLQELENCGVLWQSFQEPYVSTAGQFKDVVIAVLACVAKAEREKLSERTKAGLARAVNVGKRGKDKKPRRVRSDRGIKRGVAKKAVSYIKGDGI